MSPNIYANQILTYRTIQILILYKMKMPVEIGTAMNTFTILYEFIKLLYYFLLFQFLQVS